MLNEGIGTVKNVSSAREWYRKAYNGFLAIERNMADDKLYYRLGQMNHNGIGTEVNLDNARLYFEMADKLKNTNAAFGLGKLYLREDYSGYNPLKAVDYLEKAANANNSYAQFLLGKLYLQGDIIGQDSDLALKYLTASAENVNVGAMYYLGKELLLGENLTKDVSQGFDWLVKAMDSGNQYAKFLLAKEYLSGDNIPRYSDIAVQLLEELSAVYSCLKNSQRKISSTPNTNSASCTIKGKKYPKISTEPSIIWRKHLQSAMSTPPISLVRFI